MWGDQDGHGESTTVAWPLAVKNANGWVAVGWDCEKGEHRSSLPGRVRRARDFRAADYNAETLSEEYFHQANDACGEGLRAGELDWWECCAFFNSRELKEAGYSARELKSAFFSAHNLKEAGFSKTERGGI